MGNSTFRKEYLTAQIWDPVPTTLALYGHLLWWKIDFPDKCHNFRSKWEFQFFINSKEHLGTVVLGTPFSRVAIWKILYHVWLPFVLYSFLYFCCTNICNCIEKLNVYWLNVLQYAQLYALHTFCFPFNRCYLNFF